MPAWADQQETQEGWLTGGAPASVPMGGLPPTTSPAATNQPETTSAAAVWESDGLMGSATIPVDDSDPLPSQREPDANQAKMLMVAVALLLLVVCGLGYMLTRPSAKPKVPEAVDVLQPSELLANAKAKAAKKNFKGAALDAESAVVILQTKPEQKKDLLEAEEFLASMYLKTGDFDRAYKTYKELLNKTGDKKYAAAAQDAESARLKAIRKEAASKLQAAKSYLAKGDTGNAIMEGLHAEQLFNDGQGSNAQKAAVCYTVGRAFESQGADDRAEEYYQKAYHLNPDGAYLSALNNVRAQSAPVSQPAYTPPPEVIEVVPTGPNNVRRPPPRRPSNSTGSKPSFYTPPPPPPPPRQQTTAPVRRNNKKPGLNTFDSDKDPKRFKNY